MQKIKSIVLGLDIDEFKKNAQKAQDEIGDIGKACDKADGSLAQLEQSANGLGGGLTAVVDVAESFRLGMDLAKEVIVGTIQAIQECIDVGAEYAETLDEIGSANNWSASMTQQWDYIASQTGTSLSTLSSGYETLEKQMQKAESGSKASAEAFAALGVSVTGAGGQMRSATDVFMEVIDGLNDTDNATQKAQIGMKLFGGAYDDLSKAIDEGSEGFHNLAKDLKGMLTDEEVETLVAYGDAIDKLQFNFKLLESHLGASFAELLLPIIDQFNDWNPAEIANAVKGLATAIKQLWTAFSFLDDIKNIIDLFSDFYDIVEDLIKDLPKLFNFNFSGLKETTASAGKTGHNANGTDYWQGGMTWVGEQGPELVNIPQGSQIYNNSQSNNIAGNNTYNITMNCDLSKMKSVSDVIDAVNGLSTSRRAFA